MNGTPNNYYSTNGSVGEWNAPPTSYQPQPQQQYNNGQQHMNGYGVMNTEPIGVFQSPPAATNHYDSQTHMHQQKVFQPQSNYQPHGYTNGYGDHNGAGKPDDFGRNVQTHDMSSMPQYAAALAQAVHSVASSMKNPGMNGMNGDQMHPNHMGEMAHNGYQDNSEKMGYFNGVDENKVIMPPKQVDNSQMYSMMPPPPAMHTVSSGINFENYDNIPIDVKGDNVPAPIATFREAELNGYIQESVDLSGYVKPTPVQKHAIPTLVAGRDLMACAQTGSGKTAAFLLPIINHIVNQGAEPCKQMNPQTRRFKQFPFALILSPTRELAMQIHKEAIKFSYKTPVITVMFYGGRENYREQLTKIRNGCHIVIATPGRLIDIIQQGYMSMENCRFLVLDEADRMLDMGFEPQIRKIVSYGMPNKMARQTAMFSATFPKEIKALAEDFLNPNFVHLAVGRVGSTSENINQNVLWVEESDKRRQLAQLLEQEDQLALVLVFVETKRGANELASQLQRSGLRAVAIHGDLKQPERERNLEQFKMGANPILVATAVAARGLDIPNVKHVVNYDMPNDVDEYVHRIGRTGRCGNVGLASSFFNEKNRGMARDLLGCLNEANQTVPEWLVPIASAPQGARNNKFKQSRGAPRGGSFAPRGNFTGAPRGGMNTFGAGPQRGGFQGRQNGFNGGMPQNGGFYGGPSGMGFPPGPQGGIMGGFPPNGFPMQNGGFPPMPPQGGYGGPPMNNGFPRGGPSNFRGGFNNRGGSAFNGTRGGGMRNGFTQNVVPMRPPGPPIFGDWQPRTAPVPN